MNNKRKRSFKDVLRSIFIKDFWLKLLVLAISVLTWLLIGYVF